MMKVPQFNKQVAISLLVTFPYANLLAMDTPDVSDNSPRDTSHTTETTMYSFNLPWGGIPHFSKKTVIKDDSEPEKINDKDTPLSDSPWALPHNPCKIMFKEFGFGKSEKKNRCR